MGPKNIEKKRLSSLWRGEKIGESALTFFLGKNMLAPIDLYFAQKVSKSTEEYDVGVLAILAHLFLCSRQGHLCIQVEGGKIYPNPLEMWLPEGADEEDQGRFSEIEMAMHQAIEMRKLFEVFEAVDDPFQGSSSALCSWETYYYLQRNWFHETRTLVSIHRLSKNKLHFLFIEKEELSNKLEQLKKNSGLLDSQINCIRSCFEYPVTLITGGPGTGKTFTASNLLKLFQDEYYRVFGAYAEIAIVSPTGKAASNLMEKCAQTLQGSVSLNFIHCRTLHSLLGITRRRKAGSFGKNAPLPYNLILVDECSMIDLSLMSCLFDAIGDGCRLVLLGDPKQLPPVESGGLFKDIVSFFKEDSILKKQVIELKHCLRADLKEIVEFSDSVQSGAFLEFVGEKNISFGEAVHLSHDLPQSREEMKKYLVKLSDGFYFSQTLQNSKELIQKFRQFRFLSPFRKGLCGVESVNEILFLHACSHYESEDKMFVPIIICKNRYSMGLYNGDIGLLIYEKRQGKWFPQEGIFETYQEDDPYYVKESSCRHIPIVLLPSWEHAYCLSIHKSQGSEFDHVHVLLGAGSEVFGKEVLYTAVTRAKKSLKVTYDLQSVHKIYKERDEKISGFLPRCSYLERESPGVCNGGELVIPHTDI